MAPIAPVFLATLFVVVILGIVLFAATCWRAKAIKQLPPNPRFEQQHENLSWLRNDADTPSYPTRTILLVAFLLLLILVFGLGYATYTFLLAAYECANPEYWSRINTMVVLLPYVPVFPLAILVRKRKSNLIGLAIVTLVMAAVTLLSAIFPKVGHGNKEFDVICGSAVAWCLIFLYACVVGGAAAGNSRPTHK